MNYIGIDPGNKGAIALLQDGEVTEYMAMPLVGKEINVRSLMAFIGQYQNPIVVIEKVHSMPKQGVASTFTFGKGYGKIIGAIEAFSYSYMLVAPHEWKKKVLAGMNWKKNKKASIEYCHRRYPDVNLLATEQSRKPHDGIADAICIAKYGHITDTVKHDL